MDRTKVNLASYDNSWYHPGPKWKIGLWMFVSAIFFRHSLAVLSSLKCFLLRRFGAKVGKGVLIKPCVTIKYPWLLSIGNHCWIGENVWIDNLARVSIGSHVCLSQGAMLLTGNHDYTAASFDLVVKSITLDDGVWIGAKAIVCPGTYCETQSVLSVNSVITNSMRAETVYRGNPAQPVKTRFRVQSPQV